MIIKNYLKMKLRKLKMQLKGKKNKERKLM